MTEDEIKTGLEENERATMQFVCDALNGYGSNIRKYLADFIASLCNVEIERMMSDCIDHDVAQARALFWYAYRYMTGETYQQIGKLSKDAYGKTFTKVGVSTSVNRMHQYIEEQPIWRKRWNIVKHIIKTQNDLMYERPVPITITIPKNVELKIEKE